MVVYTLKWNKKTALLVILSVAAILCALILGIRGSGGSPSQADDMSVKTNTDRIKFLQNLGWETEETPIEEKIVVIPKAFSAVYERYNQLQLSQGYDLSDYRGMEVTIYTYKVTNYANYNGNVVAELYVAGNRVVGGDIHSLSLDGFMHGLKRSDA